MRPIGIIGNGNVAYHLVKAFSQANEPVDTLFVRDLKKGADLLNSLAIKNVNVESLAGISAFDGILLLCISDDQIKDFVRSTSFHSNALLIHTSGPLSIAELSLANGSHGVIYPFQSLTKGQAIHFDQVPLLVEGNDKNTSNTIRNLSEKISNKVIIINSEDRLQIHLASVFINNFSNNLYQIAEQLIQTTGLKLQDFEHLMMGTPKKALLLGPHRAQTGPAKRNDQVVMKKHLTLLEKNDQLKQLYQLHTSLIQKMS